MTRILPASLLMLSLWTLVSGQESSQVRRLIEVNNERFVAALNRGDAAMITAMYTRDALLLPPNSPIIENHDNIRSYWQNVIKAGVKAVELKTTRLETCGDTAYEVGQYTLTIPKPGGGASTDHGKYAVVWKREGRRWRLMVDSFSTNLPVRAE